MDFGRAFTFVKEDERWTTKIGIGAVVMFFSFLFLGIPSILLIGYQLAVTRRVMEGKDLPLPEWEDWGKLFMDGLYLVVAIFVYTLPLTILLCLGFGVFLLPALGGGNDDLTGALAGVAVVSWFVMLCLVILMGIGVAIIVPGLYIQYVRTNEFSSLFRIGEVLGIVRENLADILLAMVAVLVANFAIQMVASLLSWTICIPFVVFLAGPIWISISSGHLYGQIAAKSKMATAY
jgi:hypothetical protein